MKTTLLLILAACFSLTTFSQNNISFNFNHLLGDQPFSYNQETTVEAGYDLKIDRLEFYLSEITITHDGGTETAITGVYLLVQPNEENVYDLGAWDINSIESVQFGFGVDPGVNTADPAQWPNDHPLAYQIPSMHWGWASGYRFLAVEGTSGTNFIYDFELHALGNDNYGMVNLSYGSLTPTDGELVIEIDADYTQIFNDVDVEFGEILHGTNVPILMQSLSNCRTDVFTPAGSGVTEVNEMNSTTTVKISPNPITNDQLSIDFGTWSSDDISLTIYDALGKIVQSELINNSNASMDVSALKNGIYLVKIQNENGEVITKRFVK